MQATWYQVIADFQSVSTGFSYLPVPLGGAIIVLFVIERLWTRQRSSADGQRCRASRVAVE